jgi:magnesium transporter
MLEPGEAAELIEALPYSQAVELLEHVPTEVAAAIIDRLPSDDQADLLGEMPPAQAEEILQRMAPEEAADARELLVYPDDSAGGVMVKEFVAYPQSWTAQQVVADLNQHRDAYADYAVQYLYVVDEDQRLVGVLPIRDLLFSPSGWKIQRVMIPEPKAVQADMPLSELRAFFEEHHWFAAPVVDAAGRLIGVVLSSDVQEALSEEADKRFLGFTGIVGGEEFRSMPTWLRSQRRLRWLSLNILLNVLAASIIAFFQDTIAAVVALVVFLPMISDMSGCSGNQAVAVSLRELALGLVRPTEIARVVLKEAVVGLINGAALGVLLGVLAGLYGANPYLGLVVGGALFANTVVAVSFGGLLPLLLKRWGMDPALVSGPMLTTVTDMCGFFFVLSFATLMLGRLTGG